MRQSGRLRLECFSPFFLIRQIPAGSIIIFSCWLKDFCFSCFKVFPLWTRPTTISLAIATLSVGWNRQCSPTRAVSGWWPTIIAFHLTKFTVNPSNRPKMKLISLTIVPPTMESTRTLPSSMKLPWKQLNLRLCLAAVTVDRTLTNQWPSSYCRYYFIISVIINRNNRFEWWVLWFVFLYTAVCKQKQKTSGKTKKEVINKQTKNLITNKQNRRPSHWLE